jgi:hypothetical protein
MGWDGVRRCWRLLLALAVGVWAFGAPQVDPVGAQEEPGIRLMPSSGLRDGDVVQVELTGLAGETVVLWQCHSSVEIPTADSPLGLLGRCRTDFQLRQISASPTVAPFVVDELATVTQDGSSSATHCAASPGTCVLVASVLSSAGEALVAPFDMVASPLAVWPDGADAGSAIQVFAGGEPPGFRVTLAQCGRPVAESLGASRCGPERIIGVGAGVTETQVVLAETLTTAAGTVDCVRSGCAIATFDLSGNRLGYRDITVGPTGPLNATVSPSPLDGLVDGQEIEVAISGRPDRVVRVAQCDAGVPWGSDVEDGPCQVLAELEPVEPGEERRARVPVARAFTGADGTFVHCEFDCWLVVQSEGADEFITFGMGFVMNPTVSLSPSSGLVEGQPMTIEGSDLGELKIFVAVRCQGPAQPGDPVSYRRDLCEPIESGTRVRADETGALDADVPAAQRFQTANGAYRYCRDDCALGLVGFGLEHLLPYDMAEGSLSVSPTSGLHDGQSVTVTGSQLMSSYDGPPVWIFGSGQWSLVQCGGALPDDPSLVDVFVHCAVLWPGPLPVPGSDLSTTVEVQARPTAILGEEVDCTAAVDACVVMLARLEQDGSISTHAASVSFDP